MTPFLIAGSMTMEARVDIGCVFCKDNHFFFFFFAMVELLRIGMPEPMWVKVGAVVRELTGNMAGEAIPVTMH